MININPVLYLMTPEEVSILSLELTNLDRRIAQLFGNDFLNQVMTLNQPDHTSDIPPTARMLVNRRIRLVGNLRNIVVLFPYQTATTDSDAAAGAA